MSHEWKQGDRVILGGEVCTVDRVTPTGRVVVGKRQFNPDGRERGESYSRIRLWTESGQKEIDDREASRLATHRIKAAIQKAQRWVMDNGHQYTRFISGPVSRIMTAETIAVADRIAAAIEAELGDRT